MSVLNILVDGVGYFIENAENAGLVAQGVFDGSAVNSGTATTASFSGTAVNSGTITTEAEFTGSATNSGTVAVAVFKGNAVNTGNVEKAEFRDTASNVGTVSVSAKFADSATNAGTVQGDAVFADTAENLPGAVVVGVAQVAATAVNNGSAGSQEVYVEVANRHGAYSDGYYIGGVIAPPTNDPAYTTSYQYVMCAANNNRFYHYNTDGTVSGYAFGSVYLYGGDSGDGLETSNSWLFDGNGGYQRSRSSLYTHVTSTNRYYHITDVAVTELTQSEYSASLTSWAGSYYDCSYILTHNNLYTDSPTLAIDVKVYGFNGTAYVLDMSTWQLVVGDIVYHYAGGRIVSIGSCSGY